MTNASPHTHLATANQMHELLQAGVETRRHVNPNYLDLLDGTGPRRDQGVFRHRVLPPIYERFWRPMIARLIFGAHLSASEERSITLEMLGVSPGDRVIDVGCGTGNYTRYLAKATGYGLVVGVDASTAMITRAAERGEATNVTYLRADMCELPFVDQGFDALCCVGVLHMLDDPTTALDEMVRMLAGGGRMVLVVTHEKKGFHRIKGRMTAFGHDEITSALAGRGLVDIEQRVVRGGQFVAGTMPAR
jgi:SAM-dependent methyltransferase